MNKRPVGSYIILIAVCAFLLLPLISIMINSFATSWTGILPNGYTTDYYRQVMEIHDFWPSVGRGLIISIIPVLISGVVVILAMYTSVLYFPWVDKLMQTICMLPHTLKGIILAIAVLSLYVRAPGPLSDRIVMLSLVYCVSILPFVYQGIKNNLNAINVNNLVEAATILGATKFRAFFSVVVPNMISGILVSALLSMSTLFGDFAIIKILAGSRFMTAQQLLYNARNVEMQLVAVIVLILFAIILVISAAAFILEARSKRDAATVKVTED